MIIIKYSRSRLKDIQRYFSCFREKEDPWAVDVVHVLPVVMPFVFIGAIRKEHEVDYVIEGFEYIASHRLFPIKMINIKLKKQKAEANIFGPTAMVHCVLCTSKFQGT